MKMQSGVKWLGLSALLAMALVGCGGGGDAGGGNTPGPSGSGSSSLSGTIKIDGSSTVYPISEAVAEEFKKAHSGVDVTVASSGTGGGFKKFSAKETDISDASRPIKTEEAEAVKAAGFDFIELPVAFDALAVVVNPKNDWATSITVDELKKLWEPAAQGKITKWSQIRAGWPDKEIKLYGPGTDSGTFDYFTDAVVGEEGASRGDYTASEDDNVLVQGVAGDEGALGYFGLAYYEQNQEKIKAIPIDDGKADNGAGPQLPSAETVAAGTYQPLARPIFIYVSTASLERPEVKEFVTFYLTNAGSLAKEVGYIPLADAVYALAKTRADEKKTGSVFTGGSQVGVKLEDLLTKEGGG
jgi:phosphate transport system substrate-binding protein